MDQEFRRIVPAADTAVLFIHGIVARPAILMTSFPSCPIRCLSITCCWQVMAAVPATLPAPL